MVDVFASLWCIQRVGTGTMALGRVTGGLPFPEMVQLSTAGSQLDCHALLT